MRIKVVFISICALFLFTAQNSFSQKPVLRTESRNPNSGEFYKIGETTGNIGGAKAILLPKPTFPFEAREAGAEGKVKVEITIDESGSVISAKAVSGHPALYEAAQKAALQSKFSVPKVGGEGVKVSGFISYNFLIETPNWFKVGYDIAIIEKVPTLGFFQIPVIKKVVQPDWKTEIDLFEQLQAIRDEEKALLGNMPIEKPVFEARKTAPNQNRGFEARQSLNMRLRIPPQNPQKISISQNLVASLQQRLANDDLSLWKFNLGVSFIKIQELSHHPNTRQNAVEILKSFVQNAPAEYLEPLKNLIDLFENQSSADIREEIGKTIANLQKIK